MRKQAYAQVECAETPSLRTGQSQCEQVVISEGVIAEAVRGVFYPVHFSTL